MFPGDPVQDGDTFALVIRLPVGGYVMAAGRVVFVLDEPDRRGFGYGTLPGHPEQGEEAFAVVRRGDRMYFEITAFSRPRHPLARLAKPVSRLLQRQTTRRYIAAMHAVVGQAPVKLNDAATLKTNTDRQPTLISADPNGRGQWCAPANWSASVEPARAVVDASGLIADVTRSK